VNGPASRTAGRFAARDGVDLHYLAWASDQPRAGLIITHGFTEHAGRYEHVGQRFARGGVSTYAFDLRGHGRSEGRRGDAPAFDSFLEDLAAFRRRVRGLAPAGLPLFLLGHSMGGLIALRYLQEHPDEFAGAIVIAPWLGLAAPPPHWLRLLARVLAPVLPALPFRAGIRAEHLSRDKDIVRLYRADPLVHDRITPRLFTNIEDAIARVLEADRVPGRLLLLLAGDDRIVDTLTASAFAARWSGGGIEVRVADAAYHEILNEPDRAATLEAILGWILALVPMRQQNPDPS
jgi:alpha-beta hydrolase superfamily lysophospholipase